MNNNNYENSEKQKQGKRHKRHGQNSESEIGNNSSCRQNSPREQKLGKMTERGFLEGDAKCH